MVKVNMKLLFQDYSEIVFAWQKKLEAAGITTRWEEADSSQRTNMSRVGISRKLKLFVAEKDYENAVKFMQDFDLENSKKAKVDYNGVDLVWLILFVSFLSLIGLIAVFNIGHNKGWW